jgi:N-acetylglucosamine kinase-like BadF-type ATPase
MNDDDALLAVDGGGSKVDAALLTADGEVLRVTRLRTRDPNAGPHPDGLDAVSAAVIALLADGGEPGRRSAPRVGVYCLAGADLPQDERRMMRWLAERAWTRETVLRNDTFAVLRAGTERAWGVGIVCGFGTNCSGRSPDGREYRLPAIGELSGDWGGGGDIGRAALWHAVRADDGRGEPTSLVASVPAHFGKERPYDVMEAIYLGEISSDRVSELSPMVFAGAAEGDRVARSIVDRQADEVVTMGVAAIRALGMEALDPDVVLGGGVFHNRFEPFLDRIREGLERTARRARVIVLTSPPVVGAAMLALDHVGAPQPAHGRVRERLTHDLLDDTLTAHGRGGG